MENLQRQNGVLPADQQAIQAKCFHPTGVFVRFNKEKIEESIPGRFEEMVHTFPDRIAVKALDQSLTYIQLNEAANRLSHALLGRLELEKEPIALLLSKNVSLVIAVFGVLKAGKMYLLLDPSHPTARNRFILNHAQARLIVTDTEHLRLPGEFCRSRG